MGQNNDMLFTTAIYCRLSKDDEQVGESVSIETQKMMLVDYCMQHGYHIHDVYVDDGFSGLNFNRPAFKRLLDDIEEGKINLVITKDLSRLGRDYIQTGYFTDVYFNKKRVRYIAVNDGIDTLRDDNDIAPFKNILNDMYAKDLSRKIKVAKQQRAMKGYYISAQPPFGYKQNPNDRNRLVVDEEAAAVVKTIFELAAQGHSFSAISRKLKEMKIITPAAYKVKNGDTRFIRYLNSESSLTTWSYETVRTILLDSVYKGDMVNHKTEIINYKTKESVSLPREEYIVVPGQHEAIIEPEMFDNVQRILQSRRYNKRHDFENIFNQMVFCSECGTPMILISQKNRRGEKQPLFKCFNHYNNPEECTHYHAVLYDDLYDEVIKSINRLFKEIKNSALFEDLKLKFIQEEKSKKAKEERAILSKELSSVKKSISDMRKAFEGDTLNIGSKINFSNDLVNRQRELTQRLAMIERGQTDYDVDEAEIEKTLTAFLNIQNLTEKIVSKLIKKIEISETMVTQTGPKREITVTYTFEKP